MGLDEVIGQESVENLEKSCKELLRSAFEASVSTEISEGRYAPQTWISVGDYPDKERHFAAQLLVHYGLLERQRFAYGYEITAEGKKVFDKCIREEGEIIGLREALEDVTQKG